ncbi:MAG: DUF4920 domain-containing protein [Chitinophagales bacterium]
MSKAKRAWRKALVAGAAALLLVGGLSTAGLAGKVFGKPIDPKTGAAVELKTVMAGWSQYEGKSIIVEGKAAQVCQASGCWLILTDGANQLYVQFFDFTVKLPVGAKLRLQGELRKKNNAPYLVGTGVEVL